MLWLADLTLRSGAKKYFAEDQVSVAGNTYLPYLRLSSGPRFTRTLQADAAELELLNTDLTVGALLQSEDFEGALCELRQWLRGLDETVLILRGRLTEQEETDQGVKFRLVSELDPAQITLPARPYAQLCTWRFRKKPCGYREDAISFTQYGGEPAADIFSPNSIGNTTLAETVDAHQDRVVGITAGTGKGQVRRIKSNTATTLMLYHNWKTTPDTTSKFRVWSVSNGIPKILFQPATGDLLAAVNVGTARTIGHSTGLAMVVDEHQGDWVRITAGSGVGQQRKIKTNTATVITIDDAEPDFSPLPDSTSTFAVLYARCPKDFPSCEDRARTQAFNAFPLLTPVIAQAYSNPFGSPTDFDGGRPSREGGHAPLLP